jgi:hypothetical protein
MTKKDYILISEVIRNLGLDGDESLREDIACEFADALQFENTNFLRDRFLDACKNRKGR